MQNAAAFPRLTARIMALALAVGTGSYLILCGPQLREEPRETGPQKVLSCAELATTIRQKQIYMSTSKAGPSAREIAGIEALRADYRKRCPNHQEPQGGFPGGL